jgi:hypothetical protein
MLKPIVAPTFSYLDGRSGEVWPIDRYIRDLEDPMPSLDFDQLRIHIASSVAIVSARSFTGVGGSNRYIDTYERLEDGWKCVHACVWPLARSIG